MALKISKIHKKSILLVSLAIILAAIYFINRKQASNFESYFFGAKNHVVPAVFKEDLVNDIISKETSNLQGRLAVSILNLKTSKTYTLNQNEKFESASLYKLAVMWATFAALEEGTISENDVLSEQKITLDKKLEGKKDNQSNPNNYQETVAYTVKNALFAMITLSDNYSAILLAEKLGWQNIQNLMKNENLGGFDLGDPPQVDAKSVMDLLERIYSNSAVSPQKSEEMKKLLFTQTINDRIPKYLPPDVKVGHKTGELDSLRHDAGIVLGKNGNYIFVFLTETPSPGNTPEQIAQLSKKIFDELERQ